MTDLVYKNEEGAPVTNSVLVAQKFEKQHKDVLEKIRMMTAENSAVLEMFVESTYYNEQNKEQSLFIMNRDGFALLAMGFTGAKALEFKLDFIKKFNEMERQLKQRSIVPTAIELMQFAFKELNVNDSTKLKLLQNAANEFGMPVSILPSYTSSNGVLVPLTKILEGYLYSARKANPILEQKGVLVKKWRYSSSKKANVYFWNISEKYSHLGENQVNPSNPRETQPMWYESKKEEIVNLIIAKPCQ